jgi:hypothetical protein
MDHLGLTYESIKYNFVTDKKIGKPDILNYQINDIYFCLSEREMFRSTIINNFQIVSDIINKKVLYKLQEQLKIKNNMNKLFYKSKDLTLTDKKKLNINDYFNNISKNYKKADSNKNKQVIKSYTYNKNRKIISKTVNYRRERKVKVKN